MSQLRAWFKNRVEPLIFSELKRGVSPEGLAASASVGMVLSVVPIFGVTTGLCFVAGRVFRLNHVVLQLVNFFMYPVQLLLLLPFVRIGEFLTGSDKTSVVPTALIQEFSASPTRFFTTFGRLIGFGSLGWLAIAPVAILTLHFLLRWSFNRISSQISDKRR